LPQHLEGLGHAAVARLLALGLVDPAGVLLAVDVGQSAEGRACLESSARALASAAGTSTPRGALSSTSSTATVSPASTPASWRTARFSPSRNSPRMRVTVVRQVWSLTVARTGKRLAPSPTDATCSASSTIAAAAPRGTRVAVNRAEPMRRFWHRQVGRARRCTAVGLHQEQATSRVAACMPPLRPGLRRSWSTSPIARPAVPLSPDAARWIWNP
jgi:hypothetical protein